MSIIEDEGIHMLKNKRWVAGSFRLSAVLALFAVLLPGSAAQAGPAATHESLSPVNRWRPMIRRKLGALLATLTLGLGAGAFAAVVSTTAAQAASFSCNAKYFLKSAADNRYYSSQPTSDYVFADGAGRGWYEQFTVCRDSSWSPQFFVLKSEAMSAYLGGNAYIDQRGGFLRMSTRPLTGNHLFEWRGDGNPYFGLYHAESGRYLTTRETTRVGLGPTNLGWYEALYRQS
ncbi:hypothetical protein [Actinoplanes philippinensis]|uniref:hypothetical protein n=1 Tax=Actinoplanes philippinensis TaxID=35752 RepID=UPI0033D14651